MYAYIINYIKDIPQIDKNVEYFILFNNEPSSEAIVVTPVKLKIYKKELKFKEFKKNYKELTTSNITLASSGKQRLKNV
jgi:hypothetical protein